MTQYLQSAPSYARLKMALLSAAIMITVLLSACGPAAGPQDSIGLTGPNGIKYGGAVTIVPSPYGTFTRKFNPFLNDNASLSGTRGMIYETLLFFNREKTTITPWLATRYTWSSDLTTLTFTLRQGVQWSDGQPLTSSDVVFTLNLLRQYRTLDLNSIWTSMQNVTGPDANTVVITFKHPSTPELWYVGGQTYIVPQHIWRNIKDPANEVNPNPVGTGPFVLTSFDPNLYLLGRNPHYWQPGKPYVSELRYPAYTSNASADLILAQGSIDWTGLFSSNVEENFVKRDPGRHNHYWFPPTTVVTLYLNTAQYPFSLLPVRQAISLVIDRQQLTKEGESGYEPPSHPTGMVLPANEPFLDAKYKPLNFAVDIAKANALLQGAGFTRGRDGIYVDKQGNRLAFNMNVVSGWTDWEKDCRLMASDLKNIGMDVNVNAMPLDPYLQALQNGTFQTAISWTNSGPSPFFLYYGLLASANTAPIGKQAASNWERWSDPATDKLLDQYTKSIDPVVQQQALAGIQKIMVEQLPAIPLVYNVSWYEYTTARFEGWPDQTNPYAVPSPYTYPDSEVVALNLHQT